MPTVRVSYSLHAHQIQCVSGVQSGVQSFLPPFPPLSSLPVCMLCRRPCRAAAVLAHADESAPSCYRRGSLAASQGEFAFTSPPSFASLPSSASSFLRPPRQIRPRRPIVWPWSVAVASFGSARPARPAGADSGIFAVFPLGRVRLCLYSSCQMPAAARPHLASRFFLPPSSPPLLSRPSPFHLLDHYMPQCAARALV